MKTCSSCRREQPLEGFGNRKDSPDGKTGWCRECVRSYFQGYRERNPDTLREIRKRYRIRVKEQQDRALENVRHGLRTTL